MKRWNGPFDPVVAKTIECYVTPSPRAKLYVWRDTELAGFWPNVWNYTMSAGANNDKSHTGTLGTSKLDIADAVDAAIAAVKKSNSWN